MTPRPVITPATIEARDAIVRLMDRAGVLTGRSFDEMAVQASLAKQTVGSWRRPLDSASHRNPTLTQLTAFFAANGFRLHLWIEPTSGGGLPDLAASLYARSTLRCGTKDKHSDVETLWLDGSLVGSVAPSPVAREIVARWEEAAAAPTGSVGD